MGSASTRYLSARTESTVSVDKQPEEEKIPKVKVPEWDLTTVSTVMKQFRALDTDESGFLERRELALLLPQVGFGNSSRELTRLLEELGMDEDDGKIDCQDLFRWITKCDAEEAKQAFQLHSSLFQDNSCNDKPLESWTEQEVLATLKLFAHFDSDRSGKIDAVELTGLCAMLGVDRAVARAELALSEECQVNDRDFFKWYSKCTHEQADDVFARYGALFLNYPAKQAKQLHEWSDEEVTRTLDLFAKFDRDGSGTIDHRELSTLVAVLGLEAKMSEIVPLYHDHRVKEIDQLKFFVWYTDCTPDEARAAFEKHNARLLPGQRGVFANQANNDKPDGSYVKAPLDQLTSLDEDEEAEDEEASNVAPPYTTPKQKTVVVVEKRLCPV